MQTASAFGGGSPSTGWHESRPFIENIQDVHTNLLLLRKTETKLSFSSLLGQLGEKLGILRPPGPPGDFRCAPTSIDFLGGIL